MTEVQQVVMQEKVKSPQEVIIETRKGLIPTPANRYIEPGEKQDAIERGRDKIRARVEEMKAEREKRGFHAYNKPCVFLASLQRHAFAAGSREGWYVDVVAFHPTGAQRQALALKRLETGGKRADGIHKVIVGHDLPNPKDFEAKDPTQAMHYGEMFNYCEQRIADTLGRWDREDQLRVREAEASELERRAQEAEKRVAEAEAKVAKLESKKSKSKE